ncbi:MAG: alkaline phosphatase family protein [Thermoplasmata archaeon]
MPGADRRYVLVILDGLGDRPHPHTGDRSPVEAASTPALDRIVSRGCMGSVEVIGPGTAPESDAGVFALLGYNPVEDSPGRGVLEAIGSGLEVGPGDVAFRINFATVSEDRRVIDSRVGRSLSTEESGALAEALSAADLLADRGIRATIRATVGHRGVLLFHPVDGKALSPRVSNADPFYERIGGMGRARAAADPVIPPVAPEAPEAARTADAVNIFLERATRLLASHPVNRHRAAEGRKAATGLLVRNAGGATIPGPEPFPRRWGIAGAAVTEMPVERGIARVLGLDDLFVGPMGSDREAGYRERAERTLRALDSHAFVYVHLKGPDEPGHDGDARRKQAIVEAIDRSFVTPFWEGIDPDRTRIAITADHATPAILRGHSDDPVPLLLAGAGVPALPPPGPPKFGEHAAGQGSLGLRRGQEVMPLLLGRQPIPP